MFRYAKIHYLFIRNSRAHQETYVVFWLNTATSSRSGLLKPVLVWKIAQESCSLVTAYAHQRPLKESIMLVDGKITSDKDHLIESLYWVVCILCTGYAEVLQNCWALWRLNYSLWINWLVLYLVYCKQWYLLNI